MAESVRGGIISIDPGQTEGARAIGMNHFQTMTSVILPQAFKNVLPSLANECIVLLKETSVAGYVAVADLTRAGNLIRNNTWDAVNPLLVVALTYLTLVVILTKLLGILERRLAKSDKR